MNHEGMASRDLKEEGCLIVQSRYSSERDIMRYSMNIACSMSMTFGV